MGLSGTNGRSLVYVLSTLAYGTLFDIIFVARCNAERVVAMRKSSVRPSVCPPVTSADCAQIHWYRQKVMSWISSVILPLVGDPKIVTKFKQ